MSDLPKLYYQVYYERMTHRGVPVPFTTLLNLICQDFTLSMPSLLSFVVLHLYLDSSKALPCHFMSGVILVIDLV